MKKHTDLIDSLGRDAIATRVGAKPRRVDRVRNEEQIPAQWYAALCDMAGKTLPVEWFTFKGLGQ
jgi:hypothetical protein